MIWKTTNYKGEVVTWYDEQEISKILKLAQETFITTYYAQKRAGVFHDSIKNDGN